MTIANNVTRNDLFSTCRIMCSMLERENRDMACELLAMHAQKYGAKTAMEGLAHLMAGFIVELDFASSFSAFMEGPLRTGKEEML